MNRHAVGVQRDLLQPACRHRPSDLELDQSVDEKRDEVARHEPLDAGLIVEEHGGDQLVALQLTMPALEARLVLVGGEDLGGVGVLLVGDERPAAIGADIGPDGDFVDIEVDPVLGVGDLAVAGVGAGPSPGLLAVADLLVLLRSPGIPRPMATVLRWSRRRRRVPRAVSEDSAVPRTRWVHGPPDSGGMHRPPCGRPAAR
jgi:hypothetical protein